MESNQTPCIGVNRTLNSTTSSEEVGEVYEVLGLLGLALSLFVLLIEILIFWLIPKCRKYDVKLLFQMTLARTLNTGCEYYILFVPFTSYIWKDVIYFLCMQTDFVLVVWMFVFTKNLYNKVIVVFAGDNPRLIYITALIWIGTSPVGILCLFSMYRDYFDYFYVIYGNIKFLITVVNALIFFRIFKVAITRASSTGRNTKYMIKITIIAFVLVCITSLQVLVTDVVSVFCYNCDNFVYIIFYVVNSYQAIAISTIFVMLVKNKTKESVFKSMSIKLKEFVT